jgi:hypothetical protein
MEATQLPICPECHVNVRETDYFCYNCGKNLKPKPPSTTFSSVAMLMLGSLFLPPMGIIWGWKYIHQPDTKSKIVGYVAIIGTIILLIVIMQSTIAAINAMNEQMEKQLQQINF